MRIRSVKPEMWTDGKIVRLSDAANLLFVALLNQADDSGRLQNDPKEIECRAPRFWERAEAIISELEAAGLLLIYGNRREYIQILNFAKHQRIDKPSASSIPAPSSIPKETNDVPGTFQERSKNVPRTFLPERKGKERKGVERNGMDICAVPAPSAQANIKKTAKKPKKAKEGYQEVVEVVMASYKAKYGSPYPFSGRDGKIINVLLSYFGHDQVIAMWGAFMDREWSFTNRDGKFIKIARSMANFQTRIPDILEDGKWRAKMPKLDMPVIQMQGMPAAPQPENQKIDALKSFKKAFS